jgi:hypothetical protein
MRVVVKNFDFLGVLGGHDDTQIGEGNDVFGEIEIAWIATVGAAPGLDEDPVGFELLYPMIVRIDDIEIAGVVDREAVWFVELTISSPMTAKLREECSIQIIFFDPMVERIAHVEYLVDATEGDPFGVKELGVSGATTPPRFLVPTIAIEFGHMTVVEHVQVPVVVSGDIFDRIGEFALATALPSYRTENSTGRRNFDDAVIGGVGVPDVPIGEDERSFWCADVFVATGDNARRIVGCLDGGDTTHEKREYSEE